MSPSTHPAYPTTHRFIVLSVHVPTRPTRLAAPPSIHQSTHHPPGRPDNPPRHRSSRCQSGVGLQTQPRPACERSAERAMGNQCTGQDTVVDVHGLHSEAGRRDSCHSLSDDSLRLQNIANLKADGAGCGAGSGGTAPEWHTAEQQDQGEEKAGE